MKIMAKVKELLVDREKLARYDELTEWKKRFECVEEVNRVDVRWMKLTESAPLPDRIKQIIVAALDAEIKKLDEE